MFKSIFFVTQIAIIAGVAAQAEPLRLTINHPSNDSSVQINSNDLKCLTEAVYFEARNQPVRGQEAVAYVIMNRVHSKHFPSSVCGVVHQGPRNGSAIKLHSCQFSYYCDGRSDNAPTKNILEINAWKTAQNVSEDVLTVKAEDLTKGSTYYHADSVSPFWSKTYTQVAVIGHHVFYVN